MVSLQAEQSIPNTLPQNMISPETFKNSYFLKDTNGQCSHDHNQNHIINIICMLCGNGYCNDGYNNHYLSDNTHYIYYDVSFKTFYNKTSQQELVDNDQLMILQEYIIAISATDNNLMNMLKEFMNALSLDNKEDINENKLNEMFDSLSLQPKKEEPKRVKGEFDDKLKYERLINKLKKGDFKKIVFMTGAGISTSAGIPDFRSPDGLFQQLQKKYSLATPDEFFKLSTFFEHPEYFYDFCKRFNPNDYDPTISHYFMGFLSSKGWVQQVLTQNIDGLELRAGIPHEKIVFAHGNFQKGHCSTCQIPADIDKINDCAKRDKVFYCYECRKPCKPNIVFYGESVSQVLIDQFDNVKTADLGIISGTSLKVKPFSHLPLQIDKNNWKLTINRSAIKESTAFDNDNPDSNDLFIPGEIDDVVKKIVSDCGWIKEFELFIEKTKGIYKKKTTEKGKKSAITANKKIVSKQVIKPINKTSKK